MAPDYIGIDFGTCNCSVAAWVNNQAELIPVDNNSDMPFKIRSSIYLKAGDRPLPKPNMHSISKYESEITKDLNRQLKETRNEITRLNAQIQAAAEGQPQSKVDGLQFLLQSTRRKEQRFIDELSKSAFIKAKAARLAMADSVSKEDSLNDMLVSGSILFGEAGFNEFLLSPDEGRYINSPKNFLGAKIPKVLLDDFETIVARFLSYLRIRAEKHLDRQIKRAVIARPVNYHSTMGELGNKQAEALMARASAKAGFDEVHFIHEPLAAAYHFEQKINTEAEAMVVDLGGGTSDITFCRLSAENADKLNRDDDILSTQGIRQGGIACDKHLANGVISPLFGRGGRTADGRAIPNVLFSGTFSIDNMPEITDFYSNNRAASIRQYIIDSEEPLKLLRLQRVQKNRLTHQLMHSVERAKIKLSDSEKIRLPLDFVENKLDVKITRSDTSDTMKIWLDKLFAIIETSIKEVGYAPEIIYLTGGMGLSPIVQKAIKAEYPKISIEVADAFSSVVMGAAIKARRVFASL
ncbi:Hsp70 family protein [Psychromonas ossibalaenae]|uniref:Hsp70 family protein n=1 Tax=Psychromonas ossibalaenae TaxID=444922 RepID=UPI00035CE7E9|nr:Hsp70 family protein [Psychromonas ossibalaenae]